MTDHASTRKQKDEEEDLIEEAKECRRHGYILTGKFLGQGAYAKVYLGQAIPEKVQNNYKLKRASQQHKSMKVAIKIISTASAPEIYITKFLPREVSTMNRCYRHANVIQLYDLFATHRRIYLVLEYAECGDLLTYVNRCYSKRSSEEPLTEDKARLLFRDIIAGVNFVHARGVAHRDLKCENILLAKNRQAKLSDFGFAIEPRQNRELLRTHCGSYAYAPPEILKQQRYDGKQADLWSLGVILFAMVNGGLPFKESDAKAVLAAMKKPVYFKGCLTADCKDLIRGLLKIRPQKRISLNEVLTHAWMKNSYKGEHDLQAGGDEDRDLSGDIPTIRGRSREWKFAGQFLTPESVLKYLKERIGLRTSFLYKNPDLRQRKDVDDYIKEEDVTAHTATLTSVQLTPQLPKDTVPATPMFPPNQIIKPLSKPKPTLEVAQKITYHQPNNKSLTKSFTIYQSIDSNQTTKFPPPTKLEVIESQTEVTDVEVETTKTESKKEENRKDRYQDSTPKTKFAEDNKKPVTKLSSTFQSDSRKRSKKGRKTGEFSPHNRRSTTPNVINLNISTNRPHTNRSRENRSLSRKTQIELQALQRMSIYNAHAHRKIRCGAVSVPPETQNLRTQKTARQAPRKVLQAQRHNANCVMKKMSKTKSDNCSASGESDFEASGDENFKQIKKLTNKLMTIPESEENSQKIKKADYEGLGMSPQQSHGNGDIAPCLAFERSSNHKGTSNCPRNTPCPGEPHQKPILPARDKLGRAMAAWMGKHSVTPTERNFTETLPVSTAQFLTQNPFYYRTFADSFYQPKIQRSNEQKPAEHGKLLYKRAQASKNTLAHFTQSMKSTPLPGFRQEQSPISRSKKDSTNSSYQTSYSPPPVLRFTHKINKFR